MATMSVAMVSTNIPTLSQTEITVSRSARSARASATGSLLCRVRSRSLCCIGPSDLGEGLSILRPGS